MGITVFHRDRKISNGEDCTLVVTVMEFHMGPNEIQYSFASKLKCLKGFLDFSRHFDQGLY